MNFIPEYRWCPWCGRWYSFNPAAGQITCQRCSFSLIRKILKRPKK